MIELAKSDVCTGCGACAFKCPNTGKIAFIVALPDRNGLVTLLWQIILVWDFPLLSRTVKKI